MPIFKKFLCAILLICGGAHAASAQTTSDSAFPPSPRNRDDSQFGSPEEELRQRAAIRQGEASSKESLERAKESAQLGSELRTAYEHNRSLGPEEFKKLERLEKLARKIRSGAGGSDDDEPLKDPPARLDAALSRLAALSEQLRKHVEKTSRLVVSASVIERSNEMIELIRLIRTLGQ